MIDEQLQSAPNQPKPDSHHIFNLAYILLNYTLFYCWTLLIPLYLLRAIGYEISSETIVAIVALASIPVAAVSFKDGEFSPPNYSKSWRLILSQSIPTIVIIVLWISRPPALIASDTTPTPTPITSWEVRIYVANDSLIVYFPVGLALPLTVSGVKIVPLGVPEILYDLDEFNYRSNLPGVQAGECYVYWIKTLNTPSAPEEEICAHSDATRLDAATLRDVNPRFWVDENDDFRDLQIQLRSNTGITVLGNCTDWSDNECVIRHEEVVLLPVGIEIPYTPAPQTVDITPSAIVPATLTP